MGNIISSNYQIFIYHPLDTVLGYIGNTEIKGGKCMILDLINLIIYLPLVRKSLGFK